MTGSGERELWVAVLQNALADARRGDDLSQLWVTKLSPDLRLVCDFAGIEPESLVARCRLEFGYQEALPPAPAAALLAKLAGIRERAQETLRCKRSATT